LLEAAREYLARDERARALWPEGGAAVDLEPFPTGRNTVTAAWNHGRLGALVVRAWHAHYDYDSPMQHSVGARLLGESGLRVPEILLSDGTFATGRRRGIAILVERRAVGEKMRRRKPVQPPELVESLGAAIGRLHARTSAEWGTPWHGDNGMARPRRWFERQIALNAERASGGLAMLDAAEFRAVVDGILRDVAAFPFATARLVHGDFFAGNLIQAPDGTASFIDFETVHYGLAGTDLVSARRWLGPHGQFAVFQAAWEGATGLRMDDFAEECLLAARMTLLHKLAARVRRLAATAPTHPKRRRLEAEQRSYEEGLRLLHRERDVRMLADAAFPGSVGSTMEP